MSLRALTSPAAAIAVLVTIAALVVVGALTVPGSDEHARPRTEGGPSAVEKIAGEKRLAVVPSSPKVRRELRVLSNGCRYTPRGIPRCGALLGAAYGSNTDPTEWEQRMGRGLG